MDQKGTEKSAGSSHTAYNFWNIYVNYNIDLYKFNQEIVSSFRLHSYSRAVGQQ